APAPRTPTAPVAETPPEPLPAEAPAETIVAALPQRAVPLPEIAPRPQAEVGVAQPDQIPFGMADPADTAAVPAAAPEEAAPVEVALRVPLPTWRPDYASPQSDAEDQVLLALAEEEARAPVPSSRPAVEVMEDFAATPDTAKIAMASAEADSAQIASLISTSDLAEERARQQEPVKVVAPSDVKNTRSTPKAARATS